MDLKSKLIGFKDNIKNNKLYWSLKIAAHLFLVFSVSTMPIFTYRQGFNIIPIVGISIFALIAALYIFLFKKFFLDGFVLCIMTFILYSLFITLFTTKEYDAWKSQLTTYLMAAAIFEFLVSEKNIKMAIADIVLSSIIICTFIFADNYEEILSFDFNRIGGEYGDLNTVGLMIATGILCSLYVSAICKKIWLKLMFVFLSIVFLVFVFLTGSRGAIVTAAISYLVFAFLLFWEKHKFALIICIGCLLAFCFLILQIPALESLKERFFKLIIGVLTGGQSTGDASVDARFQMFKEGIEIWSTSPIFGRGGSAFYVLSNQKTWAHSTLADLLSAYGIVGTILWTFPMIKMAVSKYKPKKLQWLFLLAFIIPGLFHSVLYYDKFTMLLYAITYSEYFVVHGENSDKWVSFSFIKNNNFLTINSNGLNLLPNSCNELFNRG